MKVRILKCSHEKFWYNDKIGEVFEISQQTVRDYCVKGAPNNILKIDAVILKSFKCDICGEESFDQKNKVYDENFNIQQGLTQCNKCAFNN